MSSDVQSLLASQRSSDYGSLVIIIAVSYDYCVTFSNEVKYIWRRPWTWVSTLFLLIRYAGYLSVLSTALFGTSFIPSPEKVRNIIYLLGNWAYPLFWVGADMMMILRVYAMYNRSRIILGILLVMYITEVVFLFVSSSIYSDPTYVTVSTIPLLDLTLCNISFSTQTWNNASTITQFILGTVLCVLAVTPLVRESLQMHKTTRKWQLNSYMRLLVREGILYFIVTLFYSLVNMLGLLGVIPFGLVTPFFVAINIPLYTLTPRFVVNVRELYALETEGRQDRDIDTGFGLSSGVARGVGRSTTVGTMAFAQGPGGLEDVEEIVMVEERAEGSRK
ncbi:hypothetical protein L210DRAFT_3755764 [Boletus edulis BED1]|uniref:DUF6533 domain-containing protein n=1 Tax=Boletus edulis BED1 TaxID=1328754 RepID=A0AAD4C974_BOLED|nr:hypothetical protein L210DRAFT_3755764 [Boletus edulis BED1]